VRENDPHVSSNSKSKYVKKFANRPGLESVVLTTRRKLDEKYQVRTDISAGPLVAVLEPPTPIDSQPTRWAEQLLAMDEARRQPPSCPKRQLCP
jgi:hypothetical protein